MSVKRAVCSECGRGAMVPEVYAEAAQDETGERLAVVMNVPRERCAVCGHLTLDQKVAVLVGGHLGGSLRRNHVTVVNWQDMQWSQPRLRLALQAARRGGYPSPSGIPGATRWTSIHVRARRLAAGGWR